MRKSLIFGAGKYTISRIEVVREVTDIIGVIDNDSKRWGDTIGEVTIFSPQYLSEIDYDIIILCSNYKDEMRTQLIDMGVSSELIFDYEHFFDTVYRGRHEYIQKKSINQNRRNVLIATIDYYYNGGARAAFTAAVALSNCGTNVTIAFPVYEQKMLKESEQYNISLVQWYRLPKVDEYDKDFLNQFDMVIANSFLLMPCACEVIKQMPVLWWLHESGKPYEIFYDLVRKKYPQYDDVDKFSNINIVAVSEVAKKAFNEQYGEICNRVMCSGAIKDLDNFYEKRNSISFANIAGFRDIKNQKVLIDIANRLSNDKRVEFYFIGKNNGEYYDNLVSHLTTRNVHFTGELSRTELKEKLKEIDCVVCTSKSETLSYAIIEGLMTGKICITTETTGVATYIKNGENGFVVPFDNEEAIYATINYVIENIDNLGVIRENALKTYDKFFSMKSFEQRIHREIEYTVNSYSK